MINDPTKSIDFARSAHDVCDHSACTLVIRLDYHIM